jgi:hypothetical protein
VNPIRSTTLQVGVIALARFLKDCVEGVTNIAAGDRSQLRDSRRRVAQNNAYKLSEVLFCDRPPGLDGLNPKAVLAYDAGTGTFTLNDPYGPGGGAPVGVHYALLNLGGGGTTYAGYLTAISLAVQQLTGGLDTYVDVPTPPSGTASVMAPDGLDSLYALARVSPEGVVAAVKPGRGGWAVTYPRTVSLGLLAAGASGSLRFYGRVFQRWLDPDTALDTVLPVNTADLVTAAAEYVVRDAGRPREMSLGMQLAQERLRTRPPVRYPNEVLLYPALVAHPGLLTGA